jgi:chemotaxis protein MotA
MGWYNVAGFIVCVVVFLISFYLGGSIHLYFNLPAILNIVSGVFGAALLSYPFARLKTAFYVAKNSYTSELPSSDEIIKILLDLSVRSRRQGILSLEKMENQSISSFLKGALRLLVDGYSEHEIKDILSSEMFFFRERRGYNERVFRTLARSAPAFGLIASIIGLVGLLSGIGDTGVILKTIPIALMATLYGILLANFVFLPIAECIHSKTRRELLLQKLVLNGVLAINLEVNSQKLEVRLLSFLTPSSRAANEKSLEYIKKKYSRMQEKERAESEGKLQRSVLQT